MGDADDVESKSSLNEDLAQIILEIEKLEDGVEPTNSQVVQEMVKRNIAALEKLTRIVSQLAMFSENEDVSEVQADSLRFLLLPALLGFLTGKVLGEDRFQTLQRELIYYQDFLKRLQAYSIIKREDGEKDGGDASAPKSNYNVVAQARNRQMKIERFKEQRELQTKLQALRQRANSGAAIDDEVKRDLYLTELKVWAAKISENVETVQQEIEMLRSRNQPGASTILERGNANQNSAPPLKPFIITRTEMQKAVYGLGYPGLPTVTLDEFFEQKQREGQLRALSGAGEEQRGPITEEEEKIMREEQEEREHPEVVQHDREYDEYKDDHRRGWGSMHNKG